MAFDSDQLGLADQLDARMHRTTASKPEANA